MSSRSQKQREAGHEDVFLNAVKALCCVEAAAPEFKADGNIWA